MVASGEAQAADNALPFDRSDSTCNGQNGFNETVCPVGQLTNAGKIKINLGSEKKWKL